MKALTLFRGSRTKATVGATGAEQSEHPGPTRELPVSQSVRQRLVPAFDLLALLTVFGLFASPVLGGALPHAIALILLN